MMNKVVTLIFVLFVSITFLSCGTGSRAYKIEQAKIHLDNAEWDKALEVLADLDQDDEVRRLNAGAYGGKAGLSLIQMGIKFLGEGDDDSSGTSGDSDFFSFLDSIGVTSLVDCGGTTCIQKAMDEITAVSDMKKSDYFLRGFFKLFRASVSFLGIKNLVATFTENDITDNTKFANDTYKDSIACYINSFQIIVAGLKYDLQQAQITGGDFFSAVDDMFGKFTHCSGYTALGGVANVNDSLCADKKPNDGTPAACKWACSTVAFLETQVVATTYETSDGVGGSPATVFFDGTLGGGAMSTSCSNGSGGVAFNGGYTINWATETGYSSQPSDVKLLTGSEAVAGLLQQAEGN